MKKNKKLFGVLLVAVVSLVFCLSVCSCNFDEANNIFNGGELLDDNVMESIRDSIITKGTTDATTEVVTEITTESTTETEVTTESTTDDDTESNTETDTQYYSDSTPTNCETEENTEDTEDTDERVYWLKSGEVWHVKRDCRYIKNKDVTSGTVEEALEAGKSRVCATCGK